MTTGNSSFCNKGKKKSPGHAGKEGPQLGRTGASQGFPRAAAPVGVFSQGTDDTTLMAESEEELKSLLMKVKEEREKLV